MVFSWDITEIVKKKNFISSKDKKDWADFTKQVGDISVTEDDFLEDNRQINKVRKLDLHGYSLDNANKVVKKFIIESFDKGYNKLLVVTGKGLRSKSYDNPYISENLSVLKNSVPEYIKNNKIIEGNPATIKTVNDVWKFSKNMWSQDPTWYLVETSNK